MIEYMFNMLRYTRIKILIDNNYYRENVINIKYKLYVIYNKLHVHHKCTQVNSNHYKYKHIVYSCFNNVKRTLKYNYIKLLPLYTTMGVYLYILIGDVTVYSSNDIYIYPLKEGYLTSL